MSGFNFFKEVAEAKLYNDIQHEFIEQFGVPVKYMKRVDVNPDQLFGEDPSSIYDYNNTYDIRMYIENPTDFDGADEMFTKFGLQLDNQAALFVQQDHIHAVLGGVPLPDDIIYIPIMNRLFQVTKPEEKSTFYLFGKLATYKIHLKALEYSGEQLDVDILEVDNINGKTNIDDSLEDNTTVGEVADVIDFSEDDPWGNL